MTTETDKNRSEQQAQAQFESIKEMVSKLRSAKNDQEQEEATQAIQEDALSVEVRSGWYAEEYNILLCTGGPAARIIGELDENGYPQSARIEHQDWGTDWTTLRQSGEEQDILLEYASQFYFEVN